MAEQHRKGDQRKERGRELGVHSQGCHTLLKEACLEDTVLKSELHAGTQSIPLDWQTRGLRPRPHSKSSSILPQRHDIIPGSISNYSNQEPRAVVKGLSENSLPQSIAAASQPGSWGAGQGLQQVPYRSYVLASSPSWSSVLGATPPFHPHPILLCPLRPRRLQNGWLALEPGDHQAGDGSPGEVCVMSARLWKVCSSPGACSVLWEPGESGAHGCLNPDWHAFLERVLHPTCLVSPHHLVPS